jgi:hypothetical protein
VSLLLAVLLVARPGKGLLVAVAVIGLVFAALDLREGIHQANESNTGLLIIALVTGLLHLGGSRWPPPGWVFRGLWQQPPDPPSQPCRHVARSSMWATCRCSHKRLDRARGMESSGRGPSRPAGRGRHPLRLDG